MMHPREMMMEVQGIRTLPAEVQGIQMALAAAAYRKAEKTVLEQVEIPSILRAKPKAELQTS